MTRVWLVAKVIIFVLGLYTLGTGAYNGYLEWQNWKAVKAWVINQAQAQQRAAQAQKAAQPQPVQQPTGGQ